MTQIQTIDVPSALEILRHFYKACRKEFRQLLKGEEISSLHYTADGFNLHLIVKEGGAV